MSKQGENLEEVVREIPTSVGGLSGIEETDPLDELAEITEPFNPSDIDIKTKSITVDLLMSRIDHDELDLLPDFQRKRGIWDIGRQSRLIESILLRIPLPVIYVAADNDDIWLVVDGLQRLHTLHSFVSDNGFALKNLEFLDQYIGFTFSRLPRSMQRRIRETELVVHVIQPGTPQDVTRTVFKRINTGGLFLSQQEIRHALYQGPATNLLREFAESPEFKAATNYSIKDDRMQDRELVLRFLAFYLTPAENYKTKDLDSFLSNTMNYLNGAPSDVLERLRESFEIAMNSAQQIFRDTAFRKYYGRGRRYPVNKALFETWSVELSRLNAESRERLIKHRSALLDNYANALLDILPNKELGLESTNLSFHDSVSQQTSGPNQVQTRFAVVQRLIEHTLQEADDVD